MSGRAGPRARLQSPMCVVLITPRVHTVGQGPKSFAPQVLVHDDISTTFEPFYAPIAHSSTFKHKSCRLAVVPLSTSKGSALRRVPAIWRTSLSATDVSSAATSRRPAPSPAVREFHRRRPGRRHTRTHPRIPAQRSDDFEALLSSSSKILATPTMHTTRCTSVALAATRSFT